MPCGCSSPAATARSCTRGSPSCPTLLEPGDLVVVNTSGTLPARCAAGAGELDVHLSTPLPGGPAARWVVELRRDGARFSGGRAGDALELPAGGAGEAARAAISGAGCGSPTCSCRSRCSTTSRATAPDPLPLRHASERPLADYQTVYATEPGSAEMPSAGRPFTPELVTELVARGIAVAPIVLHTGVSSLEAGESPYPERFRVPAADRAARRRRRAAAAGA